MEPFWFIMVGGALFIWPKSFVVKAREVFASISLRKAYEVENQVPAELSVLLEQLK